jgi:hypothetical protein
LFAQKTGGGFATKRASIDNTKIYVVPINLTLVTTGMKLTANSDFIAYIAQIGVGSADGTLLFPLDTFGKDYMVMGVEWSVNNDLPGYVYIVATVNSTAVTVTFPNGTQSNFNVGDTSISITSLGNK